MRDMRIQKDAIAEAKGFTLLELIVGMGIFALVITSVMGIFQQVIRVERKAVSAQNAQENVRYVMEVISKELRTAKRDFGTCADVPDGTIFSVDGGALYLKNQHDQCVAYFAESGRFKIARDGSELYVTGDEVIIDYLNFFVKADGQPAVTVTLGLHTPDTTATGSEVEVQTTISSRYYLESDIL